MCGIAGILHLNNAPVDSGAVKRMGEILSHRGPDDSGQFIDRNVGLSHRRLAIIDLSPEGHQPMSNEDKTLWIIHNGEIYNYLELKETLKAHGHAFRSRSDTEVILHAFEEWGPACLNKFNGMWAFAIWDMKNRTLFASRDRLGIKPLYYYSDKDVFIFASEIKAILCNKSIPCTPNRNALYRYLVKGYGYVDTNDETFFCGIRSLKPGHYMNVSCARSEYVRYWRLSAERKREGIRLEKAKEDYLALFRDAIKLSLRSDVPVGISLSGGLDSTSLAVLASGMREGTIESFSACFDETGFDERVYIAEIVKSDNFVPHYIFPKPDELVNEFEKMIWHQDEPYSGASVFSQWKVMEEAKKAGIKVLLTGQGGDETLAGYYKYYPYYFADLFLSGRMALLAKNIRDLAAASTYPLKEALLAMARIILSRLRPHAMRTWTPTGSGTLPRYLNRHFFDGIQPAALSGDSTEGIFSSLLDEELYRSCTLSPLPSLLHIDDRNSMAHSVESRPPFLDHRLVEFLYSLPNEMKISGGFTKFILRESVKGILPENIRTRRDKMGFVTPAREWFRNDFKDKLLEILTSPECKQRRIFDESGIRALIDSHLSGKRDASFILWSLVNLELWYRVFIDKRL